MKHLLREILYGLLSGILFLGYYLIFRLHLLFSVILAVAGYVAIEMVFSPKQKDMRIYGTSMSAEIVQSIIKDGRASLMQISDVGKKIDKPAVQDCIRKICEVGEDIFKDFEKDPKDIQAGRKFVDYYLTTTLKIVTLYSDLARKKMHTDKELSVFDKAEQILVQIEAGFHRQLSRLQEDNFLDLDTELAVLEMTMKSEEF